MILRKINSQLLASCLFSTILMGHSCMYKTISQFQSKITTLRESPSIKLKSLQKQFKNYEKSIISADEWKLTLETCATTLQKNYINSSWFNNKPLSHNKNIFSPFMARIRVPDKSILALWGDLHGSIHSLLRTLTLLIHKGLLRDDFTVAIPNFYMIFLGDYVDRGKYGIEVWYILARLMIANPHNVFILRGNHEDEDLNHTYGFVLETTSKFHDAEERIPALKALFNLYNLLPSALFLETQTGYEVIQCCHGGLEIGINPHNFLHSSTDYCLIETVNRKEMVKALNHKPFSELIMSNACFSHFITPLHTLNNPYDNGFMWNDFLVDDKGIAQCNKSRGIAFGKDITQTYFSFCSSPNHKIVGVIRAHQHNNASGGNMLDLLRQNHGLVNLWNTQPTVLTLCSSPDAEGLKFNDDSFLLLTTAKNYKDWKFEHIHHPIQRS